MQQGKAVDTGVSCGSDDDAAKMRRECLKCLKTVLEDDPSGISIYDSDNNLRYCNRAFSELYGIGEAELPKDLSRDEMDAFLVTKGVEQAYATITAKEGTPPQIKSLPDGRMLQVRSASAGSGAWIRRHTVIGDANNKSNNDELLSLRALIDNLEDYLWVKDTESRFVVANRAIAHDNGFEDPSEMVGLTDFSLHSIDAAAGFRRTEQEILRTGIAKLDIEERIEGGTRWFSSSKIPLRNEKDEIIGIIGMSRDITNRKKDEALRQRAKELEAESRHLAKALEHERKINEQQRQFFSMASHEFRTPLAIIDGAAHRLLRRSADADPEFVKEKGEKIRQSVGRMIELMESYLAFSKLEAHSMVLEPIACRIGELVERTCKECQDLSPTHRITFDPGDLPETITADCKSLERVFSNLLTNAVKYSPGAPDITVRGWSEGKQAKISVQDHGLGVDAEDLPKLFDRYFRARTATAIPGTGIGLDLVARVVEMHGGEVTAESVKGQGSTFTVTLPLTQPET